MMLDQLQPVQYKIEQHVLIKWHFQAKKARLRSGLYLPTANFMTVYMY